jgi:PP-loop superfamily ATP-utilizing enzyme
VEQKQMVKVIKKAGYKYVCLDLEGYRTGAMNEVLD